MKTTSQELNMIDCQQELLQPTRHELRRKLMTARAWQLVAWIVAVMGWGFFGILIWMRANN